MHQLWSSGHGIASLKVELAVFIVDEELKCCHSGSINYNQLSPQDLAKSANFPNEGLVLATRCIEKELMLWWGIVWPIRWSTHALCGGGTSAFKSYINHLRLNFCVESQYFSFIELRDRIDGYFLQLVNLPVPTSGCWTASKRRPGTAIGSSMRWRVVASVKLKPLEMHEVAESPRYPGKFSGRHGSFLENDGNYHGSLETSKIP